MALIIQSRVIGYLMELGPFLAVAKIRKILNLIQIWFERVFMTQQYIFYLYIF